MLRDAVSRTANVERTGRHKWVKNIHNGQMAVMFNYVCNIFKFLVWFSIWLGREGSEIGWLLRFRHPFHYPPALLDG